MIRHLRLHGLKSSVAATLAVILLLLSFASPHPLQANEAPEKGTSTFIGAEESDNTGEIACSVVPQHPEKGDTFTLRFRVTKYTGEHKVFAKYTITKDGEEKKIGNSEFQYTDKEKAVTLEQNVSLDEPGNYVFKCHLWEDGSWGWFSSGNVTMNKSDTVNFEVLPPASGDVACDTDPDNPTTGEPFDLEFNVSNYTGSKKVFVKYRRKVSISTAYGVLGVDTAAKGTDNSGRTTITKRVTFPKAGAYEYECLLKEQRTGFDRDLTDWKAFSFTVNPSNYPPSLALVLPSDPTPDVYTGSPQSFSVEATDDDGNLVKWKWEVDKHWSRSGDYKSPESTFSATDSIAKAFEYQFPSVGTYDVTATFTDDENESSSASWTVSVEDPPNGPPSVRLLQPSDPTPDAYSGSSRSFSARATDDDGNLVKWKWEVDKHWSRSGDYTSPESSFSATNSITRSFRHLFPSAGTYDVTVTFTDDQGETASESWTYTVKDGADLAIDSIEAEEEVRTVLGSNYSFWFVARNHGDEPAGRFRIRTELTSTSDGSRTKIQNGAASTIFDSVGPGNRLGDNNDNPYIYSSENKGKRDWEVPFFFTFPNTIPSGEYSLCATIEYLDATYFDADTSNNEKCYLVYLFPQGSIGVHAMRMETEGGHTLWLAVPSDFAPETINEIVGKTGILKDRTLREYYRRLALQLAFREALEPELSGKFLFFHFGQETAEFVKVPTDIARYAIDACLASGFDCSSLATQLDGALVRSGLLRSGVLEKLPKAPHLSHQTIGLVGQSISGGALFTDLIFSTLLNQALNADQAILTLQQLAHLPLGPVWEEAIELALKDAALMTNENFWHAFLAEISDKALEIVQFALTNSISGMVSTMSLGPQGVALAAAIWFATEVYLDVDESHARVGMGSLASFIAAAFHDPSDTGDRREALAFAKYAAYDNFHESDDTFLQSIAALINFRPGARDELLETMKVDRREALKELKTLVSLKTIEAIPSSLSISAGETGSLVVTGTTGSGKFAQPLDARWSSSNPAIATVSADGTVTGLAPGSATITVSAEGISDTATVTVTDAPIDDVCTNGIVVPNPQGSSGLVDDCHALLLLRDAWGGTSSLNWGTSVPITQWHGISLDSGKTRVIALALPGLGLTGPIPPALFSLVELTILDLSGNKLTGTISPNFGKLTVLVTLNLSGNNLTGSLPGALGSLTSLEVLQLARNALTGNIPGALGNLTRLRTLSLSDSGLNECIPDGLPAVITTILTLLNWTACDSEPEETGEPPPEPENDSRVRLDGGTLNGQRIFAGNPSVTVEPGERITGTIDLTVLQDDSPRLRGFPFLSSRFPVVATPTWGDHERSYWRVPIQLSASSSVSGEARVNLTAPGVPGEYAIIIVAQAASSGGFVASATNAIGGVPRWDNGDDVAGWDNSTIDFAIRNGFALARQYGAREPYAHFAATAIKVVVRAGEEEVIPGSNCLQGIICYTSNPVAPPEAAAAIRQEFGEDWVVADWNDLKALWPRHQEELKTFFRFNTRLKLDGAEQWGSTGRWYFVQDNNGAKPSSFLDHDDLGGHELSLGSWFQDEWTTLAIEAEGGVPPPDLIGPQNGDRVYLTGGTLNDQAIANANPTLTVAPGQRITGAVDLTVHNDHFGGAVFPVVAMPSWGDHERSYWRVPLRVPAFSNASDSTRVNLTAPDTPGEYAIIFVAQAETTGGHIASATHWTSGGPRWDNGDDVAGWDAATIDFAIQNGYVLAPQHGWDEAKAHFGAAAVKVVVTDDDSIVVPESNCLQGILCYTSGPVEHAEAAAAIRREFGEDWVIADWNDLKDLWPRHQQELKEFFPFGVRLNVNGDAQWGSTGRWYFVEDHDGSKPGFFLAHDELGGHEISLGSWFFDEAYYLAMQAPPIIGVPPPPDPTGPQNDDRVYLNSATLNGQQVASASPSITVEAGEAISGTVTLTVHNDHFAGAVFPVEGTPTWGDHADSYWRLPISVPAFDSTRGNASVNLTAPDTPGEYAIIFVAQAELTGGYVSSATHWTSGDPRWNNGDDVANWDDATIDFAIDNGYVLAPQYGWDESKAHFGAAAIKVVVTAAEDDDEELSNCLQDILCYTSDPVAPSEAAAAIRQEFGADWVVADWNDVKELWSQHQEELKTFFRFHTRMKVDGAEQWGSTGRWYFVQDNDGERPGYFLAHDDLGGHELSLGSWFGDAWTTLAIESSEEEEETTETGPDLVVESFSVDETSVDPEERITLSATVLNQGDEDADSTTLRYYRSTDSTIDTSDTEVDTDSVSSLRPDRTSDESERVDAPSAAGTYYYAACVDAVANESDTSNNCSATVTVTVANSQSGPDLVVESFSVDETSVDPEERITLSATVRNQGDENADSTTLRYYRSTDSTIDTSDTELDTDSVSSLRPDRTSDESDGLDAPSDAGTYYYGACVDSVSDESNTSNNCSEGVAVTVKGVDLVVHSASASETRVELNDYFDFSATVENQGEGEADSSTLRYYVSTDSTIDTGDTELITERVSSLDPDETSNESEELWTPTSAGTYYFGACVDTVPGESNTQNNCSTGVEITVVEGDPNLDIALTRLSDNILGTGVSFTLAATVRNYGRGSAASTTLRYYRSTDSSITSSDTLLGTDSVGSLDAEETEDHSHSVTTPDSSGTYFYGACVDSVAGEEITYDNCSRMTVGVGDVSPDLEVYSSSIFEWTRDAGRRFNMGFQVRNQGTGPSPTSSATVRYYRSDDSTISSSDTEISGRGDTRVRAMDPSAVRSMEFEFTVHSSGTYYYGACVEVVNRETVTSNNCAAVLQVTAS